MTLSRLSLIISFILSTASISGQKLDPPTLSLHREGILRDPERAVSASITNDFKTLFFNQTLEHFDYRPESYTIFQQRYLIDSKYWGGANSSAPIFVYLGNEAPIDGAPTIVGFLRDNAAQFKALLVYIEHRYFGESIPLGMSFEEALKDANVRGYFRSAQALADYAAIIMHVKRNLKARSSPVIVVGGSYGGMLALWFRLRYPHVALGALASSAPILYFDDITPHDAYYSMVTKDFKDTSETCYQTIRDSWSEIERVADEPSGLSNLSKMFKTCKPLESGKELKNYLKLLYKIAAQGDHPPTYPVTMICNGIDGANTTEHGILGKIFAGVVAYNANSTCYVNPPTNMSQTDLGWRWQEATETCYQTIADSWSEIDGVAQEPNGSSILSNMLKTCQPLESGDELKNYLIYSYARAAQHNDPPRYPVTVICNGIDGANGILGKIFAGVVASNRSSTCSVNPPANLSQTALVWDWQSCSEMVMPVGITNNAMFQPDPFILSGFVGECNSSYSVAPRPHWVTTYYGGHDIELILRRFSSNIIFSNGLQDPWSRAGVLKNILDSCCCLHKERFPLFGYTYKESN